MSELNEIYSHFNNLNRNLDNNQFKIKFDSKISIKNLKHKYSGS